MWGKKKLKTSAAAMDLPRPPIVPPVIHNHNQVPWPGIILAGFLCLVIMFPILWWMLVFLFDRLGYRNPESEVAWWLVIIPIVSIGLMWIRWFCDAILTRILNHKMEITAMTLEKRLEIEHTRLLAAQSSADGMRMNSQDVPFAKLILAVMQDAYLHGPKGARGEIRWSRRQAKALADQHNLGLSETQCGSLAPWLRRHGVVTDKDEINRKQFDDMGKVKALVSRVFNVPINFGDIGMSEHQIHGRYGDQWN